MQVSLKSKALFAVVLLLSALTCQKRQSVLRPVASSDPPLVVTIPLTDNASPQLTQIIASAIEQTTVTTGYDPAYVGIEYPMAMWLSKQECALTLWCVHFAKLGSICRRKFTKTWHEHGRLPETLGSFRS